MRNLVVVFLSILIIALAGGLIFYLIRSGKLFSSADMDLRKNANINANNQNSAPSSAANGRIDCKAGDFDIFFQAFSGNDNQSQAEMTFKFKLYEGNKCSLKTVADECTTREVDGEGEQMCACKFSKGGYCYDLYSGGNLILKDQKFVVTQDRQIIKASY